MKAQFEVIHPTTPKQAIALKRKLGPRARFWAGGTDMILLWQRGQIDLDYCIDLSRVRGLDQIKVSAGRIGIGARVTLAQLERSAGQHDVLKTLSDVTKLMCTPQTRTLATVGGNLCNASPAADLSPVFVALDSVARLEGATGKRELPMADFFTGVKKTALKPAELLAEIVIPLPAGRTVAAYRRVARTVVDIALVNAAVGMTVDGKGRVTKIGIALGAVAPTIPRAPEAEELLLGARIQGLDRRLLETVAEKASAVAEPISDVRASAAFRKHMTKIMARRALEDCVLSLGGTVS
jgi:CO/xanthine dehydrogenase FAD-binding subunit